MLSSLFGSNSTFQFLGSIRNPAGFLVQQVRTATKRASGSKTSMKDSAGRRLGPKKGNGARVQPGQIIYRQRGTKFFPGENCDIGKDHTIFAKEHGWVQYYMDPFHPKRTFIGVSLYREKKLPTPHFEPRLRRFGRHVITNQEIADREENKLNRKQFMAKDEILKEHQERESKRISREAEYKDFLTKNFSQLEHTATNLELASKMLLLIRSNFKQGFSRSEAFFNTLAHFKHELKLTSVAATGQEINAELAKVETVLKELETSVDFDFEYNIAKYLTKEQKMVKQKETEKQLSALLPLITKDSLKKAKEILNDKALRNYFTESEYIRLRRSFIKPVLPESIEGTTSAEPVKGATPVRRFNYETGEIDTIYRKKEAFLKTLN